MNPAPRPPAFDAPAPIMRAAGAWLARRDRGFGPAECADFALWLRRDPRHAAAVAQLEATMNAFDGLRALAPDAPPEPDADFFTPRRPRRRWLPRLAVASTLAAAAALTVAFVYFRPPAVGDPASQSFATAAATERATLADGSVVTLNRDTRLVVEFSANERRVRLVRGEAHFAVAKNPARPFVVSAGGMAARAVGTAFNVRLDASSVEVLVTEGRVRFGPLVSPANAPAEFAPQAVLLDAGFRATQPLATAVASAQIAPQSSAEIAQLLSWQPRLRDLSNAPLAEIVAEFNRRATSAAHPRIVFGDPALAELRLGGSVYLDQPEAFVRLVEQSFGLRAERTGDEIVLRRAP